MPSRTPNPAVPLRSVPNTRDLGGIVTRNGQTLRPGLLLRASSLHSLSAKDRKTLAEDLHVRAILDLRTPQEQREKPDREVPGAAYYSLPVFDEQTSGISYEKAQRLRDKVKAIPNMPELYRGMVTRPDYVENLRSILQTILTETIRAEGKGAILYHCTAGKDRTGIVTLLLLSLCDVPKDAILQDYLLTNEVRILKDDLRVFAVSALLRDPEVTEGLKQVFRAEPDYLTAAMQAIDETYGSMDSFLSNQLGITPAQKQDFCSIVLRP